MSEDVVISLVWILGAASLAPVLAGLVPRVRIPEVVFLLALGMAVGPFGFALATESEPVSLLAELGLGMLFLIAGIEIHPATLRTRDGARAAGAWLASLVFALVWVGLLMLVTDVEAWGAVAIAMTSTALGALLPVLRDADLRESRTGDLVMVNGAVGEFGPIVAMSVLLSGGSAWGALASLVAFGVVALALGALLVRHAPRATRVVEIVRAGAETTAQAPLRLVLLLLTAMLAVSAAFDLDVIVGAFVAGAIVRMLLPVEHDGFLQRLDGVGFGFLVPVFFVTSGMAVDVGVVLDRAPIVVLVFLGIALTRGLPLLVAFRHLPGRARRQLAVLCGTGLPIIVAVTTLAVDGGQMSPEGQSVVVAAGMLTVLLLPVLGVAMEQRGTPTRESPAPS